MADPASNLKAVVFITKTGFQFFETGLKGIAALNFDPKFVVDMDIADQAGLSSQIQNFIEASKFLPCLVIFVISEQVSFYQDVKESEFPKIDAIKEEFVNTVPFDTLLTKSYNTRDGTRIISANEKMYREIAVAFEAKGFVSAGVIPSFVLGAKLVNITSLDYQTAVWILNNMNNLKEQSFFSARLEEPGEEAAAGTQKPAIEKKMKVSPKFAVLGVVLVLLVGVFIYLLANQ